MVCSIKFCCDQSVVNSNASGKSKLISRLFRYTYWRNPVTYHARKQLVQHREDRNVSPIRHLLQITSLGKHRKDRLVAICVEFKTARYLLKQQRICHLNWAPQCFTVSIIMLYSSAHLRLAIVCKPLFKSSNENLGIVVSKSFGNTL